MNEALLKELQAFYGIEEIEQKELIQELWSGYGELIRFTVKNHQPSSFIAKRIDFPDQGKHPRGWNTKASHERKVRSYEVETLWYEQWAKKCNDQCRVPQYVHTIRKESEFTLLIEDLDQAGFSLMRSSLNPQESKLGLRWLAHFHAVFMNESLASLWEKGTYWHLDTRKDEYRIMADGPMKQNAKKIDELLDACSFKSLVHGDAKLANFCFTEDMSDIAAVDFQYVGGGCGMKDVAYFLGSCLSEQDCALYEEELLTFYFNTLEEALQQNDKQLEFSAIEKEWRMMFPLAWADFNRFLLGWMPSHPKLTAYSYHMVNKAMSILDAT